MAQGLGYCESMLLSLRNLVGSNSPSTKITSAGALYSLLDPQTTGDPIEVGSGGHIYGADNTDAVRYAGVDNYGKPVVNIKYSVPNQATTQTLINCDVNGTPVDSETQFSLNFFRSKSLLFSFARLQNLCPEATQRAIMGRNNSVSMFTPENNTPLMNEVAEKIEGEMRGLVKDINSDVLTRLVTGIGTNAGNIDGVSGLPLATTQSVTLTNASDGSLNYLGYNKLEMDWMANEAEGKKIIVGGNKFNAYNLANRFGCCSNSGIDYAKVFQESPHLFYFDPAADVALGVGQFLVMEPGSAKFVKYNRFEGWQNKKHGVSEFGLYKDRRLPVTFDIEVSEINCPHPALQVTISLHYDVFVKPAVFAAGDILVGNRGIYRYTAA